MNNQNSNVFSELKNFFEVLKSHLTIIITTTIVTALVFAVAVFFFITPQYQSTSQLIVNQKLSKSEENTQLQGLQQADVQLVNTYKNIISSPVVVNKVKSHLGDTAMVNKSKVNVSTQPNSQVFDINVKSKSPNVASEVANDTARTFKKRVKKIMSVNNVSIISHATPNSDPVFPKRMLSILAGALVGLVLGVLLALFKEYSANTVDSVDYVSNDLGLTNLGIVNDININSIDKESKDHRRRPGSTKYHHKGGLL